jgi:hypothetical protein
MARETILRRGEEAGEVTDKLHIGCISTQNVTGKTSSGAKPLPNPRWNAQKGSKVDT